MTSRTPVPQAASGEDRPAKRFGMGVVIRTCLVVTLGLAAFPFPVLALPAGFLLWIGWLSLPDLSRAPRRFVGAVFALAGLAAAAGLVRFVIEHAMVGIVGGGQSATSRRAVSRLRELVFAQDMMRKNAFIDPDGDGVGSAAWIGELAGDLPLRGGAPLAIPVLSREWRRSVDTPVGPAVEAGGFLFIVCLPTPEGYSARPGGAVDDERAERRFLAYAWPIVSRPGMVALYSVDEHERIQVGRSLDGGDFPHIGPSRPPACDAALTTTGALTWQLWENKAPRTHLPGAPE